MEDVTKTYTSGVPALNGINLHVQKGEFVFIVGKSGSGKSTLIKLLLKELDPTSGKIYDFSAIRIACKQTRFNGIAQAVFGSLIYNIYRLTLHIITILLNSY